MNKSLVVLAAIGALGLCTFSAQAASTSKSNRHPVQKKSHVVQHGKSAVHHATKPGAKSHKPAAHKPAPKSHAKPLSRLQKRHA